MLPLQRLCHSRRVLQNISALSTASSSLTSSSSSLSFRSLSTTHTSSCNTLIIGGGPIGLSTAYHLAKARGGGRSNNGDGRRDHGKIVIVEKDPTYGTSQSSSSSSSNSSSSCSAMLSAGGIRQQYSLLENVQMSLYSVEFLRQAPDLLRIDNAYDDATANVDVQFCEHGYLFLACTALGQQQMLANHEVQRSAGCTNHVLLNPSQLKATFPWINASDILLASYGTRGEGWFDPWSYIQALKRKCIIDLGVQYIRGVPRRAQRDATTGKIVSIDIEQQQQQQRLSSTKNKNQSCSSNDNSILTTTYTLDNVVNAAGARSEDVITVLAGTEPPGPLQFPLPVKPRKRSIFFFHCSAQDGVPPIAPLTVDPLSGVYFRSEGSSGTTGEHRRAATFLCGVSPTREQSDPDIYDDRALDSADHELFDDIIWPALYHRVPAFGQIKVKSSWAGLYEYNTIDQNAIIDFHPEMPNVLMLNGFSGHGLQMSPAAGRAGAELLEHGKFQTLDLGIFSFDRCMGLAPPVLELGIV